ncbi:MAG: hypothetical protein N2644_07730 [Candidatus Sumerlaea chitinivorans]|nr:hypothetical protein [Candidatus Sumerlaea chitinivorans]
MAKGSGASWFGVFMRWLLTMNTVWGLMIITSFVVTVYRQYSPKTALVPDEAWLEGPNRLVVKIIGKDDKPVETVFSVVRRGNSIDVPPASAKSEVASGASEPAATLQRVDSVAGGFKVVWQSYAAGKYTLELNNKPVASGTLVNLQALTDAAFDYAKKAFELGLGLVSTMVLFLGLMKVGEDAGLVQFVARLMRPLIRRLFPDVPPEHPAVGAIIMNFTTGILGLGNAATPFGLKAMTELQSLNKHKHVASDAMVVLLAWNTAGFAIIPTSMLAVRKAAGCANVLEIIGPCMVAGLASTITGLVCAKLLARLPMFSVEAALAEDGETPPAEPSSTDDTQRSSEVGDSASDSGSATKEPTDRSSTQKGA